MEIGDHIALGKNEWRILDRQDNAVLLIAECVVEQRPYHNGAGDVTWADCALREYLNGAFYENFAPAEKERILPVVNNTPDNPWYGAGGGDDTLDRIFLLSMEETVCKYFGDSSGNLNNRSAKQRYWFQKKDENNVRRRAAFQGHVWWWWLRSPGRDNRRAVYVHGDGNIGIQGNGVYRYSSNTIHSTTGDNSGGVRPALWLKI